MLSITLNDNTTLHIPQSWDELPRNLRPLAFNLLARLLSGNITPLYFRIAMLCAITRFSPRKSWYNLIRDAFQILFTPSHRYRDILRRRATHRRNVRHNLIALSHKITFAFSLDNNRIIPSTLFLDNPFREIKLSSLHHSLGKLPYTTPYFSRDIIITTNITARQFCDALDILLAMDGSHDNALAGHIFAILYRIPHHKLSTINHDNPAISSFFFGITLWFASILAFFRNHHIYSVLFNNLSHDIHTISTGMNETILHLIQAGYTNTPDIPLIDYFDAQIKSLKDSLSRAIADGAKPLDIAARTNIPLNTIIALSA